MYNYSKHFIDRHDIKLVTKAFKNNFVSQGKFLNKVEKRFKNNLKTKYAICVSSATAGLHLIYMALGLQRGDYIVTTPITWVSTIMPAILMGAKIKFIDIDKNNFNMDLNKLEKFLKKVKKKPKVIVGVHFGGLPLDLKKLNKICKKYKISLIEDAAQALGAKYDNVKIGTCHYSLATVFSMQPTKTITSGEGGVILTNNKILKEKIISLRHSGVSRKKNKMPWDEEFTEIGLNYKISEINCALAYSQSFKINKFIKQRNILFDYYKKKIFSLNLPVEVQMSEKNLKSSYHLMVVKCKYLNLKNKKLFFDFLIKKKIKIQVKYKPLYKHKILRNNTIFHENFPASEEYFRKSFCLPLYYSLKKRDVDYILKNVKLAINQIKK